MTFAEVCQVVRSSVGSDREDPSGHLVETVGTNRFGLLAHCAVSVAAGICHASVVQVQRFESFFQGRNALDTEGWLPRMLGAHSQPCATAYGQLSSGWAGGVTPKAVSAR